MKARKSMTPDEIKNLYGNDVIEIWGVFHDYTLEDSCGMAEFEFHELVKCFWDFGKAVQYAKEMDRTNSLGICYAERLEVV
ncbi:MAG: hypothetical protein ACI4JQ_02020 [Ruminococcus sp.]